MVKRVVLRGVGEYLELIVARLRYIGFCFYSLNLSIVVANKIILFTLKPSIITSAIFIIVSLLGQAFYSITPLLSAVRESYENKMKRRKKSKKAEVEVV